MNSFDRGSSSAGEGLGAIIIIILLIWGGIALYNHFKPVTWTLVYENISGLSVPAGTYPSREECSEKLQVALKNPSMVDPSCGSDCKPPDTTYGPWVCKETFNL